MKRCKICGAVFSPSYANQKYCSKNCARLGKNELQKNKKIYHQVYSWTRNRMKNDIRASGKKYINPPEKIQAIKEKYKNGVSIEHIKSMLE